MKYSVLLFFLGYFQVISCRNVNQNLFYFDNENYMKISSPKDSIDQGYVIYKSISDTNKTMLRYYWDNGCIQAISYFEKEKKNGKWKQYFEDGTLSFEGEYVNDKKEGSHKIFHQNGKMSIEEKYHNGNPVGVWHYYDTTGVLLKEKSFLTNTTE